MWGSLVTRWSSGVALDQGLAEWHPVGCSGWGLYLNIVFLGVKFIGDYVCWY